MDYKKAFYSKLEECYLGVKIKKANENNISGSGFTNLLDIKSKYFLHIKEYLENLIEKEGYESNDIYNKLYTFFDSYLNETGTPFFIDTPIYKNIYAKIYSNQKDTNLFYKTQNLYYVKSDTLYNSLILEDKNKNFSVYFDASEYKQSADNNKNKVFFKLDSIDLNENKIIIKVSNQKDLFPNLSLVFKQNSNEFNEDFIKALKENNLINPKNDSQIEELKNIFISYKKQNEIDFFIHKNAKAFLEEQFDLWMFNYMYKDSQIQQWSVESIERLQNIRNIAFKIIEFIAKFEDELKAIWLKPKFAKKTNYVFSLDIITKYAKKDILNLIFKDKNFKNQIAEWKDLNLIDDNFNVSYLKKDQYKFLPIDTKYLSKEAKFKLLSSFDNLENILNGEIIKSDNFQALNSIMPKYQGKIDLIYIDPPYNTGNDGFIYADNFNHASWLSMMNNRLEIAKNILNDNGSIFISIDDNEQANLKLLCDDVFGEDNFLAQIIWKQFHSVKNDANNFSKNTEYILCYSKNVIKNIIQNEIFDKSEFYKLNDNDGKGFYKLDPVWAKSGTNEETYIFKNGKSWRPPSGTFWRYSVETLKQMEIENEIIFNGKNPMAKRYLNKVSIGRKSSTFWDGKEVGYTLNGDSELKNIFDNNKVFENPKPEKLLKRIIEISTNANNNNNVASAHCVQNEDRTQGVRQRRPLGKSSLLYSSKNEEFSKSLKVSEPSEIYNEVINDNEPDTILDFFAGSGTSLAVALKLNRKFIGVEMGEHFYKVIIPRLKKVIAGFQSGISKETEFEGGGAFKYYELESYEEVLSNCEYVLSEETKIIDYRKSRKLIKKLKKGENITLDMSGYRDDFDIFTTMSNLSCLKIKRLFLDNKGVESCEFENGDILNVNNIDLKKYPKVKNLIWWENGK